MECDTWSQSYLTCAFSVRAEEYETWSIIDDICVFWTCRIECETSKPQAAQAPDVRDHLVGKKGMAKIQKFVWKYLQPFLGMKNTVKFSMQITHFSFTMQLTWHVRFLCVPNRVRNLRQSYWACVFPERSEKNARLEVNLTWPVRFPCVLNRAWD